MKKETKYLYELLRPKTAQDLIDKCTPISTQECKPGDNNKWI